MRMFTDVGVFTATCRISITTLPARASFAIATNSTFPIKTLLTKTLPMMHTTQPKE
jgi:hypothetical protein